MAKLKKAIVTGPTGSVGISLINELIQNGVYVTAICRRQSTGLEDLPKSDLVSVIECNIDEYSGLTGIIENDYDAFFHLAWDGTYGTSRMDFTRQTRNVIYALDAVDLANVAGCKVFVGAGSQSEFGNVNGILHPYMQCSPTTGYGVGKLTAGQMTRLKCQEYGIRHEWVRIVSMFGPHDRDFTLIVGSIYKMLRGERVQFTKGEQIWDYIYNKDAARALRLVAEKGKNAAIYCCGTGQTRRLKEFILSVRDAVDPSLKIGIGELPYYPNQVMHLEADISNLVEDTGFIPEYSFEEGISETVEWVKRRIALEK